MKRWLSWLLVVCLVAFAMPAARMEAESTDSEVSSMPVESEIGEEEIALAAPEPDGESGPALVNTGDIPIDAAHFPDAAFRSHWVEGMDLDEDGWLSTYERDRVISCRCPYSEIESIQGIEYFANLKELFLCSNRLKTLTISGFSQLESVECWENPLETLVLSQLPALVRLKCHTTRLTVLDVGGCARLCDLVKTTSPVLLDKDTLEYIKRGTTQDTFIVFDANVEIKAPGMTPTTPVPAPEPEPPQQGPEPQQDDPDFIHGEIKLSENIRKKVYFNESFQINAIGTVMKYKSSKPKVASVSDTGRVTALEKAGTAKITVTTILSGKKKNIVLTLDVLDPQTPTGISLRHANPITLGKGGSIQLLTDISAKKTPAKTKLKWKSSKSSVASVDKNGQVTGKKEGEATITVTTDNKLSASIAIQVSAEQQFSGSALDQCFTQNTDVENLQLRMTSILLCNKVNSCLDDNPAEIEAIMGDMGFHDFVEHAHTGSEPHGLGYLLAYKDIDLGGGSSRRVFAIVCRGTALQTNEWLSNFTFGEGLNHEGFDIPAQRVYGVFSNYLDKYRVSDFRVWITGHSRGAAVANLLAGQYMNQLGISSKQVYCYTFACPNVKRGAIAAMNNIFNYNIGGDLVTRVPFEQWGYHRYGRTDPLKNKSKVYGIKVISNKEMDNVADNVGSLSSDPVMTAAREEFQAIGAPNVGTYSLAIMDALLKVANKVIAMGIASGNPLKMLKALKKAVENAMDASKLVYVSNTHSSDTYKLWMTKIEKKKLYK